MPQLISPLADVQKLHITFAAFWPAHEWDDFGQSDSFNYVTHRAAENAVAVVCLWRTE
jgi:hypothetical protein